MISYADNFEDVLVQRAFGPDAKGFYVDVGAYNPVEHSVTKHFYDRGWRGINVEPNPTPYEALRLTRHRDINLNIGLSNRDGRLTIFEAPGACWSVDRDMLTGYFGANPVDVVERSIAVRTLAEICTKFVPAATTIDFLKIDVEGHEREVIEGGDWAKWRPRIVLAEANQFETWEGTLLGAGYHFTLFDGVNRFYVRDEDAHLIPKLNYPANAGDRFLIHGYLRRISELELSITQLKVETNVLRQALNLYGPIGPMTRKLALGLGAASRRFPRAARLAKKVVRRLRQRA